MLPKREKGAKIKLIIKFFYLLAFTNSLTQNKQLRSNREESQKKMPLLSVGLKISSISLEKFFLKIPLF
jgi:hypothetical protein